MKRVPASSFAALLWWRALCVLGVLNICLWLTIWYFNEGTDPYFAIQIALSGVYVFVCAYRSLFPRVDLERLVLVDSSLSSIFLGRCAATIAEICFGLQLGLLVHQLGVHAGLPWVQHTAWVITFCTIVAQAFCWHSILTLNHITQAVESFLWAAGFSWMAALLTVIAMDTNGLIHLLAIAGVVCSVAFVVYCLTVDIPLYLRRFRRGREDGQAYLGIAEGARDAWDRREISHSWDRWKDDALWLTPYFSVGAWISMALVFLPMAL
ncbi:MAG: hypothetical protein ACRCVD_16195 [Halioglobus sp.]